MEYGTGGKRFSFRKRFQNDDTLRGAMEALARKTFDGLSFKKWHALGYWSENFMPYALFEGERCAANIMASLFHVAFRGTDKTYLQLGTVMTDPEYRRMGLSRFLMREIFSDWEHTCDGIYLYANDGVVDYYPKFGFIEEHEYQYRTNVAGRKGEIRKLDIDDGADRALFYEKCRLGNPFSALTMPGSADIVMFHALMFQKDNLWYLPGCDAAAVAKKHGRTLFCFDIFCEPGPALGDVTALLSGEGDAEVVFGFTPKAEYACSANLYQEEDNHLFVYSRKENPFRNNKLMFPMLCRT